MWGRVFSLVLKELQQLRRDRAAKFRLLIPTLVQLFIFGILVDVAVKTYYSQRGRMNYTVRQTTVNK